MAQLVAHQPVDLVKEFEYEKIVNLSGLLKGVTKIVSGCQRMAKVEVFVVLS